MNGKTLTSFIKFINLIDIDNINNIKNHTCKGIRFNIIRYGEFRGLYKMNNVYQTPWNSVCTCTEILPTEDLNSAVKENILISSKERIELYKKYGPFDLVQFEPTCALLVLTKCTKIDPPLNDKYSDPILITSDNVAYKYVNFFDKWKVNLDDITYFNDSSKSLIFDSIFIDKDLIKVAYNFSLDLTPIEFILASCGFLRLISIKGVVRELKGFSDINTYTKLRTFLQNPRDHIKNGY